MRLRTPPGTGVRWEWVFLLMAAVAAYASAASLAARSLAAEGSAPPLGGFGVPLSVYGYVVDENGGSMADALVRVSSSIDAQETTSDALGRYAVTIAVVYANDTVSASASKGSRFGSASSAAPSNSSSLRLDIHCRPGTTSSTSSEGTTETTWETIHSTSTETMTTTIPVVTTTTATTYLSSTLSTTETILTLFTTTSTVRVTSTVTTTTTVVTQSTTIVTTTIGPSYPRGRWERLWHTYSGLPNDPYGSFLGQGPDKQSLSFDDDWGGGQVAWGRSDRISFQSSRTERFGTGVWTLTAGGDDGVRLYLDGELVVEDWGDHSYRTHSYQVTFSSEGDHTLLLEWYENGGSARVSFNAERQHGLLGEYYSSASSGAFTSKLFQRVDPAVDFDWSVGSPDPRVFFDLFAVRWTGSLTVSTAGIHTLWVTTDDGMRLWVDGALIIDAWRLQPATEYSWTGYLAPGGHSVRLEYYENNGFAVARLGWTPPGGLKTYPIPSANLLPSNG